MEKSEAVEWDLAIRILLTDEKILLASPTIKSVEHTLYNVKLKIEALKKFYQ